MCFDLVFRFGRFVPGVTCMFSFFFFFFTIFNWCKVCLVSVKQSNFIYMPVLSTICVAVYAQESIPVNTQHCNDVFGMSMTFYGRSQDALAMLCVGRDVNIFSHDSMLYFMIFLSKHLTLLYIL